MVVRAQLRLRSLHLHHLHHLRCLMLPQALLRLNLTSHQVMLGMVALMMMKGAVVMMVLLIMVALLVPAPQVAVHMKQLVMWRMLQARLRMIPLVVALLMLMRLHQM